MTLPRYPAYRDSGVEWLGEVPAHWTTVRLGALFREAVEEGCEGLPILSVSIHDGVSDRELADEEMDRKVTRSDDVTKYRRVEPGDLVYNMMRAWQGGFGTVTVSGMVSPAYVIARPTTGLATSFVEQLLRTSSAVEEMRRLSKGVTDFRLRLYWDEFKTLKISVPPEPEQTAIAAFLDRETGKIDALVREQERLIELLAEKRRAVVSHAVTKGLDPNAPMKDSGIDWLGEVPAHWEVKAFLRCVRVAEGQVDPEREPYRSMDLIAPNHIESGTGRLLMLETAEDQGAESGKYICRAGDVVYSKIRPGLRKATKAPHDCLCSADMYPLCGHSGMTNDFLLWSILSEAFSALAVLESERVAMPKINRESLKAIALTVPPASEQHAIVAHLDRETAKLDALKSEAERAVALLKERRAALISAAVTGKIDVRGICEEAA